MKDKDNEEMKKNGHPLVLVKVKQEVIEENDAIEMNKEKVSAIYDIESDIGYFDPPFSPPHILKHC